MDKYLNVGRKIAVVRDRCYGDLFGMKGTIVDICLCGCGAIVLVLSVVYLNYIRKILYG